MISTGEAGTTTLNREEVLLLGTRGKACVDTDIK
jgi:hypothetical protein